MQANRAKAQCTTFSPISCWVLWLLSRVFHNHKDIWLVQRTFYIIHFHSWAVLYLYHAILLQLAPHKVHPINNQTRDDKGQLGPGFYHFRRTWMLTFREVKQKYDKDTSWLGLWFLNLKKGDSRTPLSHDGNESKLLFSVAAGVTNFFTIKLSNASWSQFSYTSTSNGRDTSVV